MDGMFYMCARFNQSLDGWDVSNVRTMQSMFDGALAFETEARLDQVRLGVLGGSLVAAVVGVTDILLVGRLRREP